MIEQKEKQADVKLIPVMNGKLVFAEKQGGTPTNGALLAALKKAGIVEGILESSFSLLARNDVNQVLVARAYYQDEPPYFNVYFGIESFLDEILSGILKGKPFISFEEKFLVKRNAPLLSIKEPFTKVLKYPDGRIEKHGILNFNKLDIFCGKNSVVYEDSIISLIDGSAHRTLDGRVYVYPVITVKGVGEIHGRVNEEISVKVTEDIHSHSYLDSPSNVFVEGAIHSSYIKTGGSVQALEGIDNAKEVESSKIISDGMVIAPYIKKYKVSAKGKVLVSEGIHDSLVITHDEVWANFIANSEIRCRNGLVTNHIQGNSRIFIGPNYVKDDKLSFFNTQIEIFEKKMASQEFVIKEIKDRLEKEKQTLLGYFLRLKEAGKKRIILDSSIVRLFESIKLSFKNYQQAVDTYQKSFDNYLANKSYLTICKRQLHRIHEPFIKVLGRIEPGVIIATPVHVVKVSKPLEHVLITLDSLSGRLRFTKDFSMLKNQQKETSINYEALVQNSVQQT